MERWVGRVALVTGASRGIGASIVYELVKNGMKVVGCARNLQNMQNIVKEIEMKSFPGYFEPIRCDLTNESEILSMFKEIREKFGRLDVCINNAGLSHDEPLLTGSTSYWKNMLDVNILALSICTKESIKLMQECGITDGHIIHISSSGGHKINTRAPYLGINFYCGTKFMVRALTEGLRRELKEIKSKIRVSSVSPGVVETDFTVQFLKNNSSRNADAVYKSFECLQPNDIANAVIYILESPAHVEVHDILVRPRDQPL